MRNTILIGAVLFLSAVALAEEKTNHFTGSAPGKIEDAVEDAIKQAVQAGRQPRFFEIVKERGEIENGKISKYEVTVKVGQ